MTDAAFTSAVEPVADDAPWSRLSARMIAADLARSLVSLVPAFIAVVVVGVEPTWGSMWPFVAIAAWGIVGAIADVMRWVFTRFRVTETEVQRRTGIVTKRYRSVRRDRIRSVDTHAKLRHRITGLRIVTIGAGQQVTAGEPAFALDALAKSDAEALQVALTRSRPASSSADLPAEPPTVVTEVLATLQPPWVLFNMFSVWAFFTAAGLLWGAYWLASTFGVDLLAWVQGLRDWEAIGVARTAATAVVITGIFGAIGMGLNFFATYWNFELARVHQAGVSYLRTRRGLFTTREVSRDESRIRGLTISEPLLWRWIGMADTNVITTGLGIWSTSQPTALLPRGPVSVSRKVASDVLGEPSPLVGRLARHPRRALRRRLSWGTLVTVGMVAAVAWPVAQGAAPTWVLWAAVSTWPLTLAGGLASYLALGHALRGEYVVLRSGLMSRHTTALRRDSVSTVAVRQSLLQRRLGLATVTAMTAAGWSAYAASDMSSDEAVAFADAAAPGLLEPFIEPASVGDDAARDDEASALVAQEPTLR